jgi:hypothetical protein
MAAKKTYGHQPELAYRSEIFIFKSAKDIFSFVYIFSLLYNRKDIYRTWLWVKRRLSFKIQEPFTFREHLSILCDFWFPFFYFLLLFVILFSLLNVAYATGLAIIVFINIYWQYLFLNLTIYILILWNAYLWIEDRWKGSISSFFSDSHVIFVDFECRLIEFFLLLYTIHCLFWQQRLFIFILIFAL